MTRERERGVLAIVDAELGRGFALTGAEVRSTAFAEEARGLLAQAIASDEWGLIVMDESFVTDLDERSRERILSTTIPLVVFLPSHMRWQGGEEANSDEFVARLIRRAVGYQLNIQT